MKKALIKNNLVVAICLIMVMTLLVIQLPLSAQAQVANLSTATYRLYNPNVVGVASHHYTIDANERDLLMWSGWIYEGVCRYGV